MPTVKTSSDYYKNNLSALKTHHPLVWKKVTTSHEEKPAGKLVWDQNHDYANLKVTTSQGVEILVHYLAGPEKEISDFLNVIPKESTGVVVLIGMGLGYVIPEILKQRPHIRHLLVFDLEIGIFKLAMKALDLTTALSDLRLILSFDIEPDLPAIFAPADKALLLETIHKLQHLPAFEIDPSAYQALEDKVFGYISTRNLIGNTDRKYGQRFISNRLSIFKTIHRNYLLEHLHGCFSGKPAILVAGGPSLDKNIHLLPRIENKAIIIAVDTALPALFSKGIKPHFITTIDPHPITYEKFAQFSDQSKGISLIAAPYVTPEVHQCFPVDRIFWTFSGKAMEKWINNIMGGRISTPGSSTCAHLNLTAAIIMGCDPIVYIGQDLAYSEYQDHAKNVILSNPEAARKTSFEKNPNAVWVEGIHGEMVPSNRGFLSMKTHFEEMMAVNKGALYINATEGGAHLSGTEVATLTAVIEQYCNNDLDIKSSLEKALTITQSTPAKIIKEKTNKTLLQTKKLIKIVSTYNRLIDSIKKTFNTNHEVRSAQSSAGLPQFMQKKISQAEALENKIDKGDHMMIWKILEEGTMEEVQKSERILHEITSPSTILSQNFVSNFITNLDRILTLNMARKRILSFFQKQLSEIINFHKSELLLENHNKNQNELKKTIPLLQLYFKNKIYVAAQSIIDQSELVKNLDDSTHFYEFHFFKGVIATWQSNLENSDWHFKQIQPNAEYTQKVKDFKKNLGDRYLLIGLEYKGQTYSQMTRKMLFKGLRIDKTHKTLKQEIAEMANNDINYIQSCLSTNTPDNAIDIIELWDNELRLNQSLIELITKEKTSIFFHLNARLLFRKEKKQKALKNIKIALDYAPKHPALFATAAEIFFSIEDYANGITHLNKATELDASHAVIWEKLGDRLSSGGAFTDAITAYEQGIKLIPDSIHIIKKIGDCYRENGQLEAAKEVYQIVKGHYLNDSNE